MALIIGGTDDFPGKNNLLLGSATEDDIIFGDPYTFGNAEGFPDNGQVLSSGTAGNDLIFGLGGADLVVGTPGRSKAPGAAATTSSSAGTETTNSSSATRTIRFPAVRKAATIASTVASAMTASTVIWAASCPATPGAELRAGRRRLAHDLRPHGGRGAYGGSAARPPTSRRHRRQARRQPRHRADLVAARLRQDRHPQPSRAGASDARAPAADHASFRKLAGSGLPQLAAIVPARFGQRAGRDRGHFRPPGRRSFQLEGRQPALP